MIKNEPNEIHQINEKFFGIYRGVVEDDNPENEVGTPLEDGRVQIRVWGLHTKNKTDIPTKNLPLAQPAYPAGFGSITGKGMWSIPVQGTHVFVFFENGDHMQPRYFACAPGIQPEASKKPDSSKGFADPSGTYPITALMGESDMNRLMRDADGVYGTSTDETAWQDIEKKEMPPCPPAIPTIHNWEPDEHDVEYPNNFVIETRDKQTLEMNAGANLLYNNNKSYMLQKPESTLIMGDLDVYGNIYGLSAEIHGGLAACSILCNTLVATISITTPLLTAITIILGVGEKDLADTYNNHTHPGDSGGVTGIPNEQI